MIRGFTLVEVIIYIAITGMVVSALVGFVFSAASTREKNYSVEEVHANSRFALDRITYFIRLAESVDIGASVFGVDPGVLTLNMPNAVDSPTVISLTQDDGALRVREGTSPVREYILTNEELRITNLMFGDFTGQHKRGVISVDFTVSSPRQLGTPASPTYSYEKQISTVVRVRN
jgi:type II secretory pathway pseudopilin PulG